ncbi:MULTISPECIES: Shedu immune nuclease family protein [Aurantimonas]|jgi:hypothetical protein|uniref:Shedu immune nuclease family protein n=1 Tax=Aurantimonas TaxID=182269 RepID=UPI000C571193|nr:Shedu immune nuclease family protein [Aurantimonas coralicida]MAP17898.1 hypothetical protein [Aurantimonas sp.]MCC4299861.1 DUF4263 domain-containing protein [Aurantimonas coralicida]MCD1643346.1 DUF4263 domain-containing protein [Aurantimonas coralicida]MDE0922998.1 DUF4263 domain-containing protein [Aurantimonas coralicida]
MDEDESGRYFVNKRSDRFYAGRRIGDRIRIMSEIVEGDVGQHFATIGDELVIRRPPKGRFEIKATVSEDDRDIKTLTIQKWRVIDGVPYDRTYFSFVGGEIDRLLDFVHRVRTIYLPGPEKMTVDLDSLTQVTLTDEQAKAFLTNNPDFVIDAATNEITQQDIIALAYRRGELARFERLLTDGDYFEAERKRLDVRGQEALWQAFFEENPWIFGYGLSYVFTSALEGRKLEQVVAGYTVSGAGKRVDGLLKTQAGVNALCFVEIKTHGTALLRTNTYRPGTWAPSPELVGGVAQCHETVRAASAAIGERLHPTDGDGNPTGEDLLNVHPRAFLVIGSLDQFQAERGTNIQKFRCFEAFRRNLHQPEILTFDELLHRARFIVESQENLSAGSPSEDEAASYDPPDDLPF